MRIIGKGRDYYDGVSKYGYDSTVFYHRSNETIHHTRDLARLNEFKPLAGAVFYNRTAHGSRVNATFSAVKILFCGKLYCGINVKLTDSRIESGYVTVDDTFYTLDSINEFLAKYGLEGFCSRRRSQWAWMRDNDEVVDHFDIRGSEKFMDIAVARKSPAIVCVRVPYTYEVDVIINAVLKDFHFYKVFASYAAYQEIDMFMSGVLAPENRPMVTIDDKYKIQEHGFDKFSFRNLPSKRRA